MRRLFHSQTKIEEIVDNYGEAIYTPEQAELLKKEGYTVLQDLFVQGLNGTGYEFRMDVNARRARKLLRDLNPDSNSVDYTLDKLYSDWRHAMTTRNPAQASEDAKFTTPLMVTAPIGRNSRQTRIFYRVAAAEILDVVSPDGRRFDTDMGAMGFPTTEDDFGYNG